MASQPLYSIPDAQQVGLLETMPRSQIIVGKVGYVRDPDVIGQITKGIQHFVSSGQIYAMILGFMLGMWLSGLRRG